jgi:2-methylisoborneol synthase
VSLLSDLPSPTTTAADPAASAAAAAAAATAALNTATAADSLAALVTALLSNPHRPDAARLPASVPADDDVPAGADGGEQPSPTVPPVDSGPQLVGGPTGLGTSAARFGAQPPPAGRGSAAESPERVTFSGRPSGLGTSAWWIAGDEATSPGDDVPAAGDGAAPADDPAASDQSMPELFCPGAVRDNPALGEEVNGRLVDWAEQVGIYPGRLDRLRSYNFGRLIMLTHPASDDPDRLLAAAKCVVAEWAADDYYVDEVELGADPSIVGSRLALLHAVVDPAQLPLGYAPQLEEFSREEAIARAFRSAMQHLALYASVTQIARFQHQMAILFVAWTQEADWHRNGRTPPVWEYLVQRHLNSYLPPMILIDSVAAYELPPSEFYDPRVRNAFKLAGAANVLLNDLHSAAFESDTDYNLPRVIAVEEGCSQEEAIRRTVEIHNEMMQMFVAEAAILSMAGSPMLKRFFLDTWAWLGGSREWHATTGRYKQGERD